MDPAAASLRVIRSLSAADDAPRVIRAYHGSPHSFSRFDASKIGTGEGAQAYGHGLYFAGNENVAKSYRDALERMALPQTAEEMASDYLRTWHRLDAAKQMAQTHLQDAASYGIPDERQALIKSAIALMDSGEARVMPPRGHMYEVEIRHPEQSLLNWDRPTAGEAGLRAAEALRAVRPRDISVSDLHYIRSVGPGMYIAPTYGSSIHGVEQSLRSLAKDPAGVAELRSAGVPGVRYLDGVSRQQGGGSRNYVVFPGEEDSIQIIRKYGWMLPLLMAAGADAPGSAPAVEN